MRILSILLVLALLTGGAYLFLTSQQGDYKEVLSFSSSGYKVTLYSSSGRITAGDNRIKLEISPPAEVKEFYFYMPPMPGMDEMRDSALLKKVGEGLYEGNLRISMEGPWQIRVVLGEGKVLTKDVFVPITPGKETSPPVTVHGDHMMIKPEKLQMIGVVTEEVKRRELVKTFSAVGHVEYDLSKVYDITLRADAWVEKTFGRFEGELVKKGTPLMRILSPEIEIAKEELELAKKLGDEELIRKAEEKLRYLKAGRIISSPISGVILEKRVYEGGFVKEGETAYRIADLSTVWVLLEIPLKQAPYVKLGTPVLIIPEDNPELILEGRVDYIFPIVKKTARTVKVRVQVDNSRFILRPNTLVEAVFEVPLGEVLAVPESAVIDTGRRKIVFVEIDKGMYKPVRVKLGRKAEGYYEVKGGLKEGERVVVKGTFLLDAEAQLKGLYGVPAAGGHHH